ncbi:hypothetical protein [Puniceibacterium sediminis]|uniref:hypothetical protein n=1 Tax=Puniceibacterium sediminis TaxID=1608407 RepID=UPI000B77C523|nr:hypothetical protein [Puniceibacterium sediminis]
MRSPDCIAKTFDLHHAASRHFPVEKFLYLFSAARAGYSASQPIGRLQSIGYPLMQNGVYGAISGPEAPLRTRSKIAGQLLGMAIADFSVDQL